MRGSVHSYLLLFAFAIIPTFGFEIASGSDRDWPTKWSELDGWDGLRVERQVDFKNRSKWCSLHLPAKYGMLNNEQFSRLLRLAREGYKIKVDLDCNTSINYQVLAQIRSLAVQYQHRKAAQVILGPHRSDELRLDGEIAEEFAGEYLLPTLEKYERLGEILTTEIEESLAKEICGWAIPREEMKRVKLTQSVLSKRGYSLFAKKIATECGRQKHA